MKGFWGIEGQKQSKSSSGQIGSRPLLGTCIYSILLPVMQLGFLFRNQKQPKVTESSGLCVLLFSESCFHTSGELYGLSGRAEEEEEGREGCTLLQSPHLNINSSPLASFQSDLMGDLTFL